MATIKTCKNKHSDLIRMKYEIQARKRNAYTIDTILRHLQCTDMKYSIFLKERQLKITQYITRIKQYKELVESIKFDIKS